MIYRFLDLLLMAVIDELMVFIGQFMALLANEWLNWPMNGLVDGLMA